MDLRLGRCATPGSLNRFDRWRPERPQGIAQRHQLDHDPTRLQFHNLSEARSKYVKMLNEERAAFGAVEELLARHLSISFIVARECSGFPASPRISASCSEAKIRVPDLRSRCFAIASPAILARSRQHSASGAGALAELAAGASGEAVRALRPHAHTTDGSGCSKSRASMLKRRATGRCSARSRVAQLGHPL